MAGSITTKSSYVVGQEDIIKTVVNWTSDGAGAVSGNTFWLDPGSIITVIFVPGSGGSAPTTLYDVTLLCTEHGVDEINGEGANLAVPGVTERVPFIGNAGGTSYVPHWLHGGTYELVVANAGATKSGSVEFYIARGKTLI